MTITSQIIVDAFRQSNLLAIGTLPTIEQSEEALRYLNRIVKSCFGNEAGEPLTPYPVGSNNITRPNSYKQEIADLLLETDYVIPQNQRMMLNLNSSTTVYLHPQPDDGSRFAVSDISNNLAVYNLIVVGNGRLVDNLTQIVLNENGLDQEWFFREDLGTWLKYAPLTELLEFPFPSEFDDYFISMLALRLNPSYGQQMDGQSNQIMQRSLKHLRGRYSQTRFVGVDQALLPSKRRWTSDANSAFSRGYPW
jgi:hypothetical protein